MPLDVSSSVPSDFGSLFNDQERTSIVVNNAGLLRGQKFLQTDPAQIEAMIKTNVHPYVYMTKYALLHFKATSKAHNHRNAMLYTSSSAAHANITFFGVYAGTKTHNYVFANLIRN